VQLHGVLHLRVKFRALRAASPSLAERLLFEGALAAAVASARAAAAIIAAAAASAAERTVATSISANPNGATFASNAAAPTGGRIERRRL
jgi:hypothetical protein